MFRPHPSQNKGHPLMGCAKSDVEIEQDSASSCRHIVNSLSKIDTGDSALPKKALQTLFS